MALDKTLFKDKTFSDVLEEIYNNSKKKDKQITALIGELKPLVENIGDATLVVPMIANYLEIGVKNDEMLVKMLTIVQRMDNAKSSGDTAGFELGAEELAQILDQANALQASKD
jgi:hypothetical protein|tara:strand:- start:75 stop:416 length:342 start_codon:yes stop_codon:yes gene_type:complete